MWGSTFLILFISLLFGCCVTIHAQRTSNIGELRVSINDAIQTNIIKAAILKHIGKSNSNISSSGGIHWPGRVGGSAGHIGREETRANSAGRPSTTAIPVPVRPAPDDNKGRNTTFLVLGEASSAERDGCFVFPMSKRIKRPITPVKMDLYVHLTDKVYDAKQRKKEARRKARQNNKQSRRRRRDKKSPKKSPKRKNKSTKTKKRKRKGKRIKLSVSNGSKRLSKLRMRVTKTNWYDIELPISRFPKVMTPSDTFKLCISCKRCNKNVKLDLYPGVGKTVTIPFIHFQPLSHLPHTRRLRSTRSSSEKIQNGGARSPQMQDKTSGAATALLKTPPLCCRETIYTKDVGIPYLLQPTKFNYSVCETIESSESVAEQPATNRRNYLLSTDSSKGIQRKCEVATFDSFTYSFLDSDLKIRYASIPNLLPRGCKCV